MKICAVSFHSCPYARLGGDGAGGMSVYLRELSKILAGFPDVKIDIFTRVQNSDLKGIVDVSSRVRIIHLEGGAERPFDRKELYESLPEFTKNILEFISREKEHYDLLYTHYWLSGLAGEQVKYTLGLPLVHTYHTLALSKIKTLGEVEHKKRLQSEHLLAHVSDLIISSSLQEKKSLISEYGISTKKVRVVYPGVNKNLFYPYTNSEFFSETGCKEKEQILLYVGRIEPVKGLNTIIETLAFLKHNNASLYSRLKLVVIGGGRKNIDLVENKEYVRLLNDINEKGIDDKVLFLGSKKQEELKKYYSAADALIVPSLYESFGLVVVEALACGCPVLVSQVGKMKTIVKEGKNGYSFSPKNPAALSSCLENFFSQKRRLWTKDNIRQDIVKRFSWEKTASQTFKIFSELVKVKPQSTTIFQHDESLRPA
ncbi:glycosyltransferase [Acidobacteriota bacterium]